MSVAPVKPAVFDAVVNPYQGCYLGPAQLPLMLTPENVAGFIAMLVASIKAWQDQYRLIWLELPATHAALIAPALSLGFNFHHCHSAQLMLVKKLQPDSYVPLAATHSIGVGGLVWSPAGEVLMVRELALPGQKAGYFKLPGGMVEPQEHLAIAVVREVLEETGVHATFQSVLGVRHHHRGQFGASNLYIVCQLQAQTMAVFAAENEIAEVRWFSPDAYLGDEKASEYNKLLLKSALKYSGLVPHQVAGYSQSAADHEIFLPEL
ncbi:NUDIX domain-containing protein [Rheinheimera riviphila]|uniref:NUDIX domain-containing protein n=1 Tax=Rheinheimera riviphila TaxID=1834037 RepID=A0A437QT70_9GAMM|nr:NUDIX domain-containing protein [Rheinheimera riviphila]RVU37684.1 NUDIX domain-containing protein [Rheinheimera riviphila]